MQLTRMLLRIAVKVSVHLSYLTRSPLRPSVELHPTQWKNLVAEAEAEGGGAHGNQSARSPKPGHDWPCVEATSPTETSAATFIILPYAVSTSPQARANVSGLPHSTLARSHWDRLNSWGASNHGVQLRLRS